AVARHGGPAPRVAAHHPRLAHHGVAGAVARHGRARAGAHTVALGVGGDDAVGARHDVGARGAGGGVDAGPRAGPRRAAAGQAAGGRGGARPRAADAVGAADVALAHVAAQAEAAAVGQLGLALLGRVAEGRRRALGVAVAGGGAGAARAEVGRAVLRGRGGR